MRHLKRLSMNLYYYVIAIYLLTQTTKTIVSTQNIDYLSIQ